MRPRDGLLLLACALALAGCQFPKDPEGTLDKVRDRGTMEVGVLVVPTRDEGLIEHLEQATRRLRALDWKMQDVVVVPVRDIEGLADLDITLVPGGAEESQGTPR